MDYTQNPNDLNRTEENGHYPYNNTSVTNHDQRNTYDSGNSYSSNPNFIDFNSQFSYKSPYEDNNAAEPPSLQENSYSPENDYKESYQDSYQSSPRPPSDYYLEGAYEELAEENKRLKSGKKTFLVTTALASALFLASAGYLVYSEVKQPLFGKWPGIAKSHAELTLKADSLVHLNQKFDSLLDANGILSENVTPVEQTGVFFEVQIVTFQNFNLEEYLQYVPALRKENTDSLNKYTIGHFRDLKKAEQFRADIQRMGIGDAFIVAKVNGVRAASVEEGKQAARKMRY